MPWSRLLTSLACTLLMVAALPVTAGAAPSWLAPISLGSGGAITMTPSGWVYIASTATVGDHQVVRVAVREPGGQFRDETIATAGTEVSGPRVVGSASGTRVAVWGQRDQDGNWRVTGAVSGAGGGWGPSQTLSGPSADWPEPVVAIADTDEAWVIWHRASVKSPIVEGSRHVPGGGWGGVESLSATDRTATRVQMVMDPAGNATAVWISTASSGDSELVSSQRPVGGVWSSPTAASDITSGADKPNLTVDGAGRVAVVWTRFGQHELRVATREPGTDWSDSVTVGAGSTYPSDAPMIAADGAGGTTVAWSTGSTASVNWLPRGGSWGVEQNISAQGFSDAFGVRVAGGPAGQAYAAWWQSTGKVDGQRAQARIRDATGVWGPVQDIAGEPSSGPSIAADGEGNVFVAYSTNTEVKARVYDASGPDLDAPRPAAPLVAGAAGTFAVRAVDRWSGLSGVTWDFGDGATGSGTTPSHVYATPGSYRVTVTATDSLGTASTRSADVTVAAPPPAPEVITPPAPTVTPTVVPAPRVIPAPPRKLSKTVRIPFSRGYVTPGVSRKKACRGALTLTLKAGKKVLAKRAARLNRRCRFAVTFSVKRSQLTKVRSVTVIVRFHGNRYLDATTNSFTLRLDA